jgi:hypothetical protein
VYINPYFDLAYRLPPGWREGMAGPDPSESGYYVLSTLVPDGEFTGTILPRRTRSLHPSRTAMRLRWLATSGAPSRKSTA